MPDLQDRSIHVDSLPMIPDDDKGADRSPEVLEREIAELAAHIDAATWRLLRALREFDRQEAWGPGFLSCAHWLSWRTGMDLVTAREKVRIARALDGLPKISHAFRQGRISYSKVRAMVRIATAENEAEILHIATEGTASHIEKLVRVYRAARRGLDAEEVRGQRERRYLDVYTDEDGMMVIRGRLPPEVGALVKKALDAAVCALKEQKKKEREGAAEKRYKTNREDRRSEPMGPTPSRCDDSAESSEPEGCRCEHDSAESSPGISDPTRRDSAESRLESPETFDQLYADALGLLAEAALGRGLGFTERGEPYQVVVHVDAHTLADSGEDGRSETANGEGISPETSRRIACDAPVVTVTHGANGEPLHTGRKSRKVSTALWRALSSRDKGCQFPGCSRSGKLQAHHINHWAQGGKTDPENLVLLCRAHHWAVHEGGFTVQGRAPSALTFIRPDGRTLPASPGPACLAGDPVVALKARHQDIGLAITAETPACNWDGGPMDYDIALMGIMGAEEVSSSPLTDT